MDKEIQERQERQESQEELRESQEEREESQEEQEEQEELREPEIPREELVNLPELRVTLTGELVDLILSLEIDFGELSSEQAVFSSSDLASPEAMMSVNENLGLKNLKISDPFDLLSLRRRINILEEISDCLKARLTLLVELRNQRKANGSASVCEIIEREATGKAKLLHDYYRRAVKGEIDEDTMRIPSEDYLSYLERNSLITYEDFIGYQCNILNSYYLLIEAIKDIRNFLALQSRSLNLGKYLRSFKNR
jgi:hypothetical protein